VFLFVLDPVYRATVDRPALLAGYCYLLDVCAIAVAFYATVAALRMWLRERQVDLSSTTLLAVALLWMNFGPLYAVLAVKNVEIWETALLAVGCLALMRGAKWTAAVCVAAAALTKMLPFVFFPYLLLRDRPTFARAIAALGAILIAAQVMYGTDMGIGYLPNMIRAGAGASGYGNAIGMTWHENVSLRGLAAKAFGYLETPDPAHPNPLYSRGYFVVNPPPLDRIAAIVGFIVQATAIAWAGWMLIRRRDWSPKTRILWDFAFLEAMMLIVAPQASHDYMVLALGGFSFALVLCLVKRASWFDFAIATLLVANIVPRGLFAKLVLIDPIMRLAGDTHLTRAEAYQYFGFPLLGLMFLVRCLSEANLGAAVRAMPAQVDA
jgi:hypothetical protein